MDRYEYRLMEAPTPKGIQLLHKVWDNLHNEVAMTSVQFSSKYAAKQWIKRNQEIIEETV